ncbi:DUF4118 domain-containing protein [Oscillochloris sp. ZM17-4]|uniref:sensor histidine kinase n=1 Tax=Oscillochloris sp. ZM17-4 TaxID=2866714 RepID=UPI001C72ED8F|nr:ATP-binding protein [Oscillochloris sp. ZM17-4]MBX0331097.1 DUF4118 domain-containing protein [Oscillochloris sp. ZM17-4]
MPNRTARPSPSLLRQALLLAGQLLLSLVALAALTALLSTIFPTLLSTASLLYVLLVLAIAATLGLWPAILISILAAFFFNYYFIVPQQPLRVSTLEDSVRLITFITVALLTSSIAGRARSQALVSSSRAAELDALYQLSQTISAELSLDRIAPAVAQATTDLLRLASCRILVADSSGTLIEQALAGEPRQQIDEVVLRLSGRPDVVLQVTRRRAAPPLSVADRSLLATISAQLMGAVERSRLAEAAAQMRALDESDRLKSTLLSSVSHDLRTPLAVIKGAATNLLDEAVTWDAGTQRELLLGINQEADRLSRLVSHLLEMSRIEAGALQQSRRWEDLSELIHAVARSMGQRVAPCTIALDIPDDLPSIRMSYVQIEQVMTNLVDNAGHHAPPGTQIAIIVRHIAGSPAQIMVEVLDRGPGISPAIRDHIFEKFVRAEAPERRAHGSGLGLAICKGLIEAHGGQIWAEDRAGGGARFVFTLPVEELHPSSGVSVEGVSTSGMAA